LNNKKNIAKILRGRTRFHNVKSERLAKSQEMWKQIQGLMKAEQNILELRNKIAACVSGYGLKEAGHFLRNIGKSNNKIAILDRHILRNLELYGAIKDSNIKNNKNYLELENSALNFAEKTGIPIDELDLLFWHKEHGEFFK
jgi:N-glycosylase/DNA lyase